MIENKSARNMWGDYLDAHLEHAFVDAPKVICFCDADQDPNECAKLVRQGKKRSTSKSLLGLQYRKERMPKIGDFMVVTDAKDRAQCIVRTTAVKYKPFFSIKEEDTQIETGGVKSFEHWKKSNWDHYVQELEPFGRVPRDSMIIVYQEFEKVFER